MRINYFSRSVKVKTFPNIIAVEIINFLNNDSISCLFHRLLDSLVVECWLRVREVVGQGPHHTKDVIKWYQKFPCLALNIEKGNTGSFSRIKIRK